MKCSTLAIPVASSLVLGKAISSGFWLGQGAYALPIAVGPDPADIKSGVIPVTVAEYTLVSNHKGPLVCVEPPQVRPDRPLVVPCQ